MERARLSRPSPPSGTHARIPAGPSGSTLVPYDCQERRTREIRCSSSPEACFGRVPARPSAGTKWRGPLSRPSPPSGGEARDLLGEEPHLVEGDGPRRSNVRG